MMAHVILSASDAAALCARIASALGYPRPGRDAVTGVERDDGVGATILWVEPLPHPSDPARAAVPMDATIAAIDDADVRAAVAAAVELGPEWDPPRLPI